MHLDRLTKFQTEIANKIFSLDTIEEVHLYIESLPSEKQQEALSLIELMLLAETDDVVDMMTAYPLAEKMLNEIKR